MRSRDRSGALGREPARRAPLGELSPAREVLAELQPAELDLRPHGGQARAAVAARGERVVLCAPHATHDTKIVPARADSTHRFGGFVTRTMRIRIARPVRSPPRARHEPRATAARPPSLRRRSRRRRARPVRPRSAPVRSRRRSGHPNGAPARKLPMSPVRVICREKSSQSPLRGINAPTPPETIRPSGVQGMGRSLCCSGRLVCSRRF